MFHRYGTRFLLGALVATALVAACSSDDGGSATSNPDGGGLEGGSSGASSGGPTDGSTGDGAIPDGPDVPPVAFPSGVPLLFGYTLEDAFPGTFLSGAMDIDWPAGSTQPFVLQRGGDIVRLHGDGSRDLVLDFEAQVYADSEAGALGMALHPKFADPVSPQPYVYVWFNHVGVPTTHQWLSRWTWDPVGKVFDPASQFVLVDQTEAAPEHNGAHIRFGADSFLYFGNGDDTRPEVTTQTVTGGLFSGIFRIDVDSKGGAVSHAPPKQPQDAVTQGYFIPNDNPFVGVANAAEEYFALGFRNPYSFNFDRTTGKLFLGDVGDTWREEVDQVVAGGNYGWPFFEGKKQHLPGTPTLGTVHLPVFDYTHASMADLTAIMGGYVYRGAAMPELAGKFIHSDWPTGRVWAVDTAAGTRISLTESNQTDAPVGWGQDAAGEVYLVAWSKILKVVRAPAKHTVPLKLSQTHIFRNLSTLKIPTALTPYSIRSPLWSDGASKQRWVYVPAGQQATMTATGEVSFPAGSMLIKQFDLPTTSQPVGGRSRHLETRVIVIGADVSTTYGVTYRWNAAGTDADLVIEAADETIADAVPANASTWHYPSSGECWSCHRAANRVLGFRGEQLNFDVNGTNQLAAFGAKKVFDPTSLTVAPAPLATPSDTTATLDARASAYLAANCSPCHHPGASYLGGGDTWNALPGVAAADRGLINAPNNNYPMANALGIPNAPLITPGDPANSILLQRLKATDQDLRMPPLLRTKVDPVGVSVIEAWITALPP